MTTHPFGIADVLCYIHCFRVRKEGHAYVCKHSESRGTVKEEVQCGAIYIRQVRDCTLGRSRITEEWGTIHPHLAYLLGSSC